MKALFTIAVIVVLITSLPALARAQSTETASAAVEFNITLTDYSFVIEGLEAEQPLQLQAGQAYLLHFKNTSATLMSHEVLIGKDPLMLPGGFKHDYSEALLGDVEVVLSSQMDGKDFTIGAAGLNEFELAVGQEMTLEFTLPDDKVGDWEMGCFQFLSMDDTEEHPGPSHYDVGMHLPIVVSPASDT